VSGVGIHYLDWGGSGPALVFIPGFGNSAHVFDDFAPRFTDRFRVIGVTRVGFGESDQPEGHSYDPASRVAQISAVLDSLEVVRAVLVGHSLGGDEITAFASEHPDRTLALVYLDAAYDHVEAFEVQQALASYLAGAPEPTPADLAGAPAFQAYLERVRAVRFPLGEVLAMARYDSTGAVSGPRTPPRVGQALVEATPPLDYSRVRSPVLAIYSDWETAADVMPWLRTDSAANADATAELRAVVSPWQDKERARLAREVPAARITAFHAAHYQFLDQPAETERRMREFLASQLGLRQP